MISKILVARRQLRTRFSVLAEHLCYGVKPSLQQGKRTKIYSALVLEMRVRVSKESVY
jgi:hypothetical protein